MIQARTNKTLWYLAASVGLLASLIMWRADSQVARADQLSARLLANGGHASGGLITHVLDLESRKTRVIVVDPQTRAIGVYDVAHDTGEIQLKSIRRVHADLQLIEFNSGEPSPEDIQNRLDQK